MCPVCNTEAYCDSSTEFVCECKYSSASDGEQCPGMYNIHIYAFGIIPLSAVNYVYVSVELLPPYTLHVGRKNGG